MEENVRSLLAQECFYFRTSLNWAVENELTLDKNRNYAIVMGNEVKGVQQEVIDHSHGCIEIPQYGTKHSLNVSVTAGIVIWDLFNKLK